MSTTIELEPALRYLADHPSKQMDFIAGKFQIQKKEIWDWLTLHNRGQKDLSHTRIDSALAGSLKGKPAAEAKADDSARNETPKPRRVVKVEARPPAETSPTFERPWLSRRWRSDGFKSWRDALVRMAATPTASLVELCEGDKRRAMAFAAYKRGQLGAGEVCSEAVLELIAYGDAKQAGEAAPEPSAPKPVKVPRVRVDTILEIQRPRREAAPVIAAAGWTEIKPAVGSSLDYDVRYSGAATKVHRLGFTRASTERFGELGFAVGGYVRIHWNAKSRQLALTLSPTGFKMRNSGKDALSIAGKALVDVLGQDAIEFEQLDPVKGFDLVLGERGGES